MENNTEFNPFKYPYRGIQTEISKVLGVSPQAVSLALKQKNPKVIDLYNEILEKRVNGLNKLKDLKAAV